VFPRGKAPASTPFKKVSRRCRRYPVVEVVDAAMNTSVTWMAHISDILTWG
jgi:hypothetical protein